MSEISGLPLSDRLLNKPMAKTVSPLYRNVVRSKKTQGCKLLLERFFLIMLNTDRHRNNQLQKRSDIFVVDRMKHLTPQ